MRILEVNRYKNNLSNHQLLFVTEQDLWLQAKGRKELRRYGKMIEKHT